MPSVRTVPVRPQTPLPKILSEPSVPKAAAPPRPPDCHDAPRRDTHYAQLMPAEALPPNPLGPTPQWRERCISSGKNALEWLTRVGAATWGARTILTTVPSLAQTATGVVALASQGATATPAWLLPFAAPVSMCVVGAMSIAGAVFVVAHLMTKATRVIVREVFELAAVVGCGIAQGARSAGKMALTAVKAMGHNIKFMFSGEIAGEIAAFLRTMGRGIHTIVLQVFRTLNRVLACVIKTLVWVVSLPQMCFDAVYRLESFIKKRMHG